MDIVRIIFYFIHQIIYLRLIKYFNLHRFEISNMIIGLIELIDLLEQLLINYIKVMLRILNRFFFSIANVKAFVAPPPLLVSQL